MRYGSVCSGIEAATVAWHGLGWKPAFFSEIEPFPRAVLEAHYPETPLHGDFTTIGENDYESIELLVGGTPCQSFSIAGLRKGMDDERGNLALEYLKLAQRLRPKWLVWENVPGVLSSNGGQDFASFLRGLLECGYGFAYRVLDAQYFGVAQRRRRVFAVGYLGDWRPAAAVLFERESLSGHPKPSREKREKATKDAVGCLDTECGYSKAAFQSVISGHIIPTYRQRGFGDYVESQISATLHVGGDNDEALMVGEVAGTLCARDGKGPTLEDVCQNKVIPIHDKATRHAGQSGKGSGNGLGVGKDGDPSPTLTTGDNHAVCYPLNSMTVQGRPSDKTGRMGSGIGAPGDPCPTISTQHHHAVATKSVVRRLTPTECERLQGFPDGYTKIPYRNKEADKCPDGPRYKALGNSMAVPVMKWIGERIDRVESILQEQKEGAA